VNELPNPPTSAVVLAALRSRDERAHALGVEWLARYGNDPVRCLVLEATNTQHPVEYRLRVLRAIGRIGTGTHLRDYPELWTLLHDEDPEVRSAAGGLIDALGRGAKEAEGQAERSPPPGARPTRTSGGTAASRGRRRGNPTASTSPSAAPGAGLTTEGSPSTGQAKSADPPVNRRRRR
jgi:hypothetical protein